MNPLATLQHSLIMKPCLSIQGVPDVTLILDKFCLLFIFNRIEKIRIEAFSGYQGIPEVQASRIENAKLQFRYESTLQMSLKMLSLYSFDEWPCLEVRDRDEKFVTQVQEESLKLLNRCDLFDEFKTSSAFNICPRKITQSYCKVYIHLRSPLTESQKNQVQVTVEKEPFTSCPITSVQHHNPFTLSFDVPEKLLGVSSFLKVNLFIERKLIGSREVKCEGPMEVLRDLLKTAVDPITLICQALDISPASDDLDEYLTQKLKGKLPTLNWMKDKLSNDHLGSDKDLPTWLHFSAFYGLHKFTWALLELQNFERALVIKNSKGHTPAKLALQAGYTKLAQDLENLTIIMSLAQTYTNVDSELKGSPRVSRSDINSAPLHTTRTCLFSKTRKEIPLYDTPPHPRPLSEISLKCSQSSYENFTSTPKENTVYVNIKSSPSVSSSEGEQYLDMSGSFSTLENYNDICNLMTAWDKKNDVQTFLNEYEHTISKLKENLNLHSSDQKGGASVSTSIREENEELQKVMKINKENLKVLCFLPLIEGDLSADTCFIDITRGRTEVLENVLQRINQDYV
ncbi:Phosphoinositide 3-kinase adapter protein 1 [Armadillidium nasatum]|uniref:Phosphoinositide 3-kinase adapter protein 1 n=1 Tax=Armadillidium nasatum TaxID=96803 RepID=A0A5N5SKP4_9CRUS|nr:Phosphoinositide 3-kinase adapter protein 1 [Armadillidium nasatum]